MTAYPFSGHSHEAFAFCGRGDTAGFGASHPLIPMAGDEVVDRISNGSGNDQTHSEHGPETG